MTLNQIFDAVQYGEKYMKEKALKEEISKAYDKELDLYYPTTRAKKLSIGVVMTEGEEQKLNRLLSKITVLEGRVEAGNAMTPAYKKMQTAAVMEDCNSLMEEVTKSRKVDSGKIETFGRIIGSVKYFMESYIDDKAAMKQSSNPLFVKFLKEEFDTIKETV